MEAGDVVVHRQAIVNRAGRVAANEMFRVTTGFEQHYCVPGLREARGYSAPTRAGANDDVLAITDSLTIRGHGFL
jgi:hypothetical protein